MLVINPIKKQLKIAVKRNGYEIVLIVKPLTYAQKSEITTASMKIEKGDVIEDRALGLFLTLKDSLTGIEGVNNPDGTKYELEYDIDGRVADKSLDELLDSSISDVLSMYAYRAQTRTPEEIIDVDTNKPMVGVTVVPDNDTMQKK